MKKKLKTKKRVVVIGGGTGTYMVLTGLKKDTSLELTAIISSTDDGGSNRKFRDEFGLLPPSDFRQCLIALSPDNERNQTLRKLMMYRFNKGIGLDGQTFGNIMIAALTDIEGSQLEAFESAGKLLNIKGDLLPITTDNVRLMAEYEDGSITYGEHFIDEPEADHDNSLRIKRLFLNKKATAYPKALKAIKEADAIVIGPGDIYTSLLAAIIVGETAKTICKSKAKLFYITNLMTKPGQTYGFTAKDHVNEIKKYIGKYPDYVLINNYPLPPRILERYKKEEDAQPVVDDLRKNGYTIIRKDLVARDEIKKVTGDKLRRSLIRHDGEKIAKIISESLKKPAVKNLPPLSNRIVSKLGLKK